MTTGWEKNVNEQIVEGKDEEQMKNRISCIWNHSYQQVSSHRISCIWNHSYQQVSSLSSWRRIEGQRTTRKGRGRLPFWHFICQDTIISMLLNLVLYKLMIEMVKRIDWRRRVNLGNNTKIWRECFTSVVKIRDCGISGKFDKQGNRQDISCTEHYRSQKTVNCNVLKFMKRDELTKKMVPELDFVDEV